MRTPSLESFQALLPEYRLVRQLGRGGKGIVFLAHRRSDGFAAAVKFLLLSEQTDGDLRRFQREAAAYLAMRHPNLLQLYEARLAGETFGPTVPSVLIKNLFGGVPAGSYYLTMTFTKRPSGQALVPTAPVLESCSAHFFVTAR